MKTLKNEQNVQECDATGDAIYTNARLKKITCKK